MCQSRSSQRSGSQSLRPVERCADFVLFNLGFVDVYVDVSQQLLSGRVQTLKGIGAGDRDRTGDIQLGNLAVST